MERKRIKNDFKSRTLTELTLTAVQTSTTDKLQKGGENKLGKDAGLVFHSGISEDYTEQDRSRRYRQERRSCRLEHHSRGTTTF